MNIRASYVRVPDRPASLRYAVVVATVLGAAAVRGTEIETHLRRAGGSDGGQIPEVALTACGRPEDRVRSLSAGFSTHASKPVDPVELGVIVANLAGRSPSG